MNESFSSLKPSQRKTLEAWHLALERTDLAQLPESCKEEIKQIQAELLAGNHQVIQKISHITEQNPALKHAYEIAREELTEQYSSQSKDKLVTSPIINGLQTEEESKTETKEVSILKALDIRSLTIENLMYRLNIPEDKVIELIHKLWDEGKIDTARGNLIGKFIPRFRNTQMELDDYFALTFKGQLQLESLKKAK
ncbi:MAG: hypothetical protein AB4058_21995 [Microcystaceae cyanobacterium]